MSELRTLRTTTGEMQVSGATLADVAKLAGVSPITVSRALNQPHLVRPNTVAKVQAAVQQTGYVKNMMAGALASNRSRLVSLVLPTISTPIFADMVQAASDHLTAAGYQVMLGLSSYEAWREELLVETILSRRPDGVILTGSLHTDSTRRRLQAAQVPVVEAWDLTPSPIDMMVGFSHEEVGHAIAQHLLERGYKRIAILAVEDPRAARRNQGLQAGLAKLGVQVAAVQMMPLPSTFGLGRDGLSLLLERCPDVDAVVCSSDTLAHGVLTEAIARGLSVPGQLAVVGFGDLNFAERTYPPLSTVRVDGANIGRVAAQAILDRLDGKAMAGLTDTGFQLIQRGST
ncbi:transcriptional regulator, LacI family [Duganella sp. CF402]|uniref:LacI family DNA-binding transcriptional regulator n=1 Tax=unclassified Duganella TaxID=2636909 RepID=UPI0008BDEC04|nr:MULTISPECIES: LacI family DNA-binding transcriptional regulator [unclassified Duganella]RZT11235.1 LacI family transcriptional regulator [Duganella sp. BK701]SEK74955.1 transcriptional regulator, LacI family [Duganella sp. CF402]